MRDGRGRLRPLDARAVLEEEKKRKNYEFDGQSRSATLRHTSFAVRFLLELSILFQDSLRACRQEKCVKSALCRQKKNHDESQRCTFAANQFCG